MKCKILFSMKNKKTISKCRLLNFLPSMQSVKYSSPILYDAALCAFVTLQAFSKVVVDDILFCFFIIIISIFSEKIRVGNL